MRGGLQAACWLFALLFLASTGSVAAGGFAASTLFPNDGVLRVRVSPGGEWIVASAYSGETAGLLAQRFGSREVEVLYTTKKVARSLHWVGADTLLAEFGRGSGRRFLMVRFKKTRNGGFEFDTSTFRTWGLLVDSLPLVEGVVVWELDYNRQNTVHRVSLDELMKFGARPPRKGSVDELGERVARISGSSYRWLVDPNGIPLVAWRKNEDGYSLLYRASGEEKFETIHGPEQEGLLKPHGWTGDARNLLVTAYHGAETIGLFEYDPRERAIVRKIYQRDDVDIDWVHFDPVTRDVLSVQFDLGSERKFHYLESSRAEFAPKLGSDGPPIEAIRVVSSDAARRRFVYWTEGPTEPGAHYLRNLDGDETALIGQEGKRIDREALRPLESFSVESTDGISVEALLTLPAREGPASDGPTSGGPTPEGAEAHPLVVMPHGGPIGVFDRQEFDPIVQYLASWGFAVLQANYRGSGGYGEEFLEAGKRQWSRGIEDDILAAVEVAAARPEVDGNRVCIIGGSYGGYSAITSAIRRPERFRCAATINGVSDIPLLFESSDFADHERARKHFEELVGDPATERDALEGISPVYQLGRLQTPLFVVYGDGDRRVDRDHAHRLVALLTLYAKEFRELVVEGGRHSFTRDEWIGVLPQLRRFLTEYLTPERSFEPDPRPAVN